MDRKRLFALSRRNSLCFMVLLISTRIVVLWQFCNKVLCLNLLKNITATFYMYQFVTGNFMDILDGFQNRHRHRKLPYQPLYEFILQSPLLADYCLTCEKFEWLLNDRFEDQGPFRSGVACRFKFKFLELNPDMY